MSAEEKIQEIKCGNKEKLRVNSFANKFNLYILFTLEGAKHIQQ